MRVTPERWQQIARIYEAAADLDQAAQARFLSEACAGDDSLRGEVESLLRQEAADVVLDVPVWATAASLFDEDSDLAAGSTLGPYRIEGPLGAGGMGKVFRGTDTRLNRPVAIKVLPAGGERDSQLRARFAREARAVAALAHPHICTLYDVGRQDEVDYLVMEYLEGDTLAMRLARGPMPISVALAHATEIASALVHAHRHGIIHRDLKPGNIILTAGGAKLLDFGLAKFRASAAGTSTPEDSTHVSAREGWPETRPIDKHDADSSATRGGDVVGTVRYMAPEQIEGREVDPRSDLFAFGAVLYEMLTGKRAFDGADAMQIRAAILECEPPPISSLVREAPAGLSDLVRRCLTRSPEQRWQSAVDVMRALRDVSGSMDDGRGRPGPFLGGRAQQWVAGILIVTVVGLTAWVAGGRRQAAEPPTAFAKIRSVAVLPLESLRQDHEYFADAMTEQLIAELARTGTLHVIAQTSTQHYRNAPKPVPAIARDLSVDAVIAGSVIHANGRVEIIAKLIRGSTGQIIWTRTFGRPLRDVLMLQREIARAITAQVDVTLTPEAQARLASARPVDPELHRQVLIGRHQAAKSTEEGLNKAIKLFETVISKDPENALAHASLAEAYTYLSGFYMHPRLAMPKAKRAAEIALKLDDSLADAHAALGYIHLVYDWDGPAAERELLHALDLNSTLAMARLNYAAYLTSQGRNDEAIREIRQAVNFDPLSIRTYSFGTLFLLFTRSYDEALELARKGLEFEPESAFTIAFQSAAYSAQGRHTEALDSITKAARFDNSLTIRALQAHVLANAGRDEEARRMVREIEEETRTRYFCPYEIATVYVTLGDRDTANRWFRKGIDDRADCMPWLAVEPWMDPFRADPSYAVLLKQIGLTPIGAIPH